MCFYNFHGHCDRTFLEILQTFIWLLISLFGTVKEAAFSLEPLDYPTQFSFSSSVNAQQKTEDRSHNFPTLCTLLLWFTAIGYCSNILQTSLMANQKQLNYLKFFKWNSDSQ